MLPRIEERGTGNEVLLPPDMDGAGQGQIRINGRHNRVEVEAEVLLRASRIIIRGSRCSVLIRAGCRFAKGTLMLRGEDCRIEIGAGTTWESGSIIASAGASVTVGEDCMFSSEVMIRTSDGHGIFDSETGTLLNPPDSVVVGDHVWIGNGARVGKGTRIGQGCVLGQASLATGELDPFCVYGGVPARKLRSGIAWSRTQSFEAIPERFRGRGVAVPG